VRIKLMETRLVAPEQRAMGIAINGQPVVRNLDIAATAAADPAKSSSVTTDKQQPFAGMNCAADLVFNGISPTHGVIAVQFTGCKGVEALVSAIEVGPGSGGTGITPR
jgi:hypothetical protein